MNQADGKRTVKRDRDFLIYYAKVLLREAAARRDSRGGFHALLLNGAARARRDAYALRNPQLELFDGASNA